MTETIDAEAYTYDSNLIHYSSDDAFFQAMLKLRGRADNNLCKALNELIFMCVQDDTIFDFVYNTPAPTYQNVRFIDWFLPYYKERRTESQAILNDTSNTTQHNYHGQRMKYLDEIEKNVEAFKTKVALREASQKKAMEAH